MTHYNTMKGSGYTEPDVPPSQDLDEDDPTVYQGNTWNWKATSKLKLQFYGNERTMNLNPLILANVQGSPYFKNELFEIRTFHEVVDEIYYKVDHLEPWAAGSRKTAGRSSTGMCGGVRGVSAGGVTSSAFCLLYKLYTLKLTKKQVLCLLNHCDSPYIRGIGFMYLRFTLPPAMMWDWFELYLDDEEEIDVKAGGGKIMTMGEMIKAMITRLEWFETRFPRIAVNHEKIIREKLEERAALARQNQQKHPAKATNSQNYPEEKEESKASERSKSRSQSRSKKSRDRDRSRDRERRRSKSRSRSRERKKKSKKEKRDRSRERSRERYSRDRSRDRDRHQRDRRDDRERRHRDKDYADELRRYKEDSSRQKKHSRRSRSRSR